MSEIHDEKFHTDEVTALKVSGVFDCLIPGLDTPVPKIKTMQKHIEHLTCTFDE